MAQTFRNLRMIALAANNPKNFEPSPTSVPSLGEEHRDPGEGAQPTSISPRPKQSYIPFKLHGA